MNRCEQLLLKISRLPNNSVLMKSNKSWIVMDAFDKAEGKDLFEALEMFEVKQERRKMFSNFIQRIIPK